MFHNIRYSFRLVRIIFTLARYDALFFLRDTRLFPLLAPLKLLAKPKQGRPGQRLALALQDLGPTFIKLGQALSTRSDLIGEGIAEDLAMLRDRLPAFPSPLARATIEQELGAPLSTLFLSFDDVPVAAASIAQVHFAITHAGETVAVKILRPDIEAAFARDIELFFWIARLLERYLPTTRRLKPIAVVQWLQDTVANELDLRLEAASATQLKKNLAQDAGFTVPTVYWQLTAQRVLTLERIDGIAISDVNGLKASGHDLDKLIEKAAYTFFNQVFRDGFFHADLHPGNLFVQANGDIAVVDFGIMGRLDRKNRIYLAEILRGFLNEDFNRVAKMHIEAGWVPRHKSTDQFALACMAIAKPILGKPLNEISVAKLLGQLFKVSEQFEMETQTQLLLLQKTMMMAEGVGRMLNPNVNMWQVAQPLIEQWGNENLGPEAKIRDHIISMGQEIRNLPSLLREAREALQRFNHGGITLHTITSIHDLQSRHQRQWLWFAWTIFLAVTALALVAYRYIP